MLTFAIASLNFVILDFLFAYCSLNFVLPQEDKRTCKFLLSEQQYDSYLRAKVIDEGQCFGEGNDVVAELKQEMSLMKQQLDMALVEIGNMKLQRSEVKQEKKAIALNISVVVAGCVGLLIGLLVRAMLE